ncbi:hypothetical protein THRCLA_20324 [Thraustotheca clavata]|uniref:Uncharacterized protein n=1 Tax=Thraustotheca clavata TaxID=74557 RepID=A0A1W0A8N4_9STRA|nr:hypothetical protein THRCLA_20324 [Thraustotheca clavata]
MSEKPLKKLWTKVLQPFSFTKEKSTSKSSKVHYVCTCVHLNAIATSRRQRNYDQLSTKIKPLPLPNEFVHEKKDLSFVGGRKVPFCPVQNTRWKSYRKTSYFETIHEDNNSFGPIICPGCMSLARLSNSTDLCEESDEDVY